MPICYPCLRPYNSQKIQYRSSPCTFLGYNLHHKGYKCLSSSERIYISRHVVFKRLSSLLKKKLVFILSSHSVSNSSLPDSILCVYQLPPRYLLPVHFLLSVSLLIIQFLLSYFILIRTCFPQSPFALFT